MTRRGEWVHENSSGSFAYLANRIAYRRGAWNFARRIAVPEHVEEVRLCQRVCRPTTKTKRMTKKVMDPGEGGERRGECCAEVACHKKSPAAHKLTLDLIRANAERLASALQIPSVFLWRHARIYICRMLASFI